MSPAVRAVGIVGAGRMGTAIAIACAKAHVPATLYSRRTQDAVLGQLSALLARRLGGCDLSADDVLARVTVTDRFDEFRDCDLVVECVPEDVGIKQNVFRALGGMCPPTTILASNTSSLSVTELALSAGRPDRFVGLHFFNPADKMALVELVLLPSTSPDVRESLSDFLRTIGKEPIVMPDSPGFVVNRLLFAEIREAISVVAEGTVTVEDVDRAMRLGANRPIGPLALADVIGLDVCYSILANLALGLGPQFEPPDMLCQLIACGMLGRKSGAGFYTYRSVQ